MAQAKQPASGPGGLWKTFIRLQNPLMKWLLVSPFHGVVSRMYLLLTFTGRKSGKVYTTPVQYAQQGDTLLIITSAGYVWWRNLKGGADVRVRLRGQDITGRGDVSQDAQAISDAVAAIYPQLGADRRASFVPGKVLVRIQLDTPRRT